MSERDNRDKRTRDEQKALSEVFGPPQEAFALDVEFQPEHDTFEISLNGRQYSLRARRGVPTEKTLDLIPLYVTLSDELVAGLKERFKDSPESELAPLALAMLNYAVENHAGEELSALIARHLRHNLPGVIANAIEAAGSAEESPYIVYLEEGKSGPDQSE